MTRDEARAALVLDGGNAFAVGSADQGTVIVAPPRGPMSTDEAANLCAWLIMVAGLTEGDVLPILDGARWDFWKERRTGAPAPSTVDAASIYQRFVLAFEKHKPCATCTGATGKDEMCDEGRRLYVGMLSEIDEATRAAGLVVAELRKERRP
jgi:hypothetical protein